MTGSLASASPDTASREGGRVLVCSTNWLGDAIMSMPALQTYRAVHPNSFLTVLTKPNLHALWAMHGAPDDILVLHEGKAGMTQAAREIRKRNFGRAFIFPNSFRSALIPFLGKVPARIGRPQILRRPLLSEVIRSGEAVCRAHQSAEYFELMGLPLPEPGTAAAVLQVDAAARNRMAEKLKGIDRPLVALIPGAARGPSKQWPEARFLELGQRVIEETPSGLLLLGTPQDGPLCARLAEALGPRACSLAGSTTLPEFAAVLAECAAVVANDSGGMHLAAAVGTPVIALYGITDPGKTGPLGPHCTILQHSEVRQRDVPRESEIARKALEAIQTEEVFNALARRLDQPQGVQKHE